MAAQNRQDGLLETGAVRDHLLGCRKRSAAHPQEHHDIEIDLLSISYLAHPKSLALRRKEFLSRRQGTHPPGQGISSTDRIERFVAR
jgi:hypothetical protein